MKAAGRKGILQYPS